MEGRKGAPANPEVYASQAVLDASQLCHAYKSAHDERCAGQGSPQFIGQAEEHDNS